MTTDKDRLTLEHSTPKFRDKEERRLITLSSLDGLIKFLNLERSERNSALKFYSAFIAGGGATIIALSQIYESENIIEKAGISSIVITIVIILNFLMMKKMMAVRRVSTEIYHEYGNRLRYLLDNHSTDLSKKGEKEFLNSFKKYINNAKHVEDILPKYSIDRYEIYGMYCINILFSTLFFIPGSEIGKDFNCSLWLLLPSILVFFTIIVGFYIIKTSRKIDKN